MSNTKKYGIKYLNLKKYLDNQIYLNNKGGSNLLITGDSYRERLRQIDEDELDISDTPTYLYGFDKTRTNTDMNKLNNLMDSQLKKAESLQKDINTVNKKEYLYNLERNTKVDHARLQQDMEVWRIAQQTQCHIHLRLLYKNRVRLRCNILIHNLVRPCPVYLKMQL